MKKIILLFCITMFVLILSGCSSDNTNTTTSNNIYSSGNNTNSDSGCSCSSNIYNCDDFSTHREAQACFEKCGGVRNDVHQLDRDGDSSACETLP